MPVKISFVFKLIVLPVGKHLATTFLLQLNDVMFMWMVRTEVHILSRAKYLTLIRTLLLEYATLVYWESHRHFEEHVLSNP